MFLIRLSADAFIPAPSFVPTWAFLPLQLHFSPPPSAPAPLALVSLSCFVKPQRLLICVSLPPLSTDSYLHLRSFTPFQLLRLCLQRSPPPPSAVGSQNPTPRILKQVPFCQKQYLICAFLPSGFSVLC